MAEDQAGAPHWDKGDPIKADQLNKLSANSNTQFSCQPPLYFRQVQNSVIFYLRNGNESDGGSSAHPFKGYNTSTTGGASFAVNRSDGFVGQVNSITPTLNGTPIGGTVTGSVSADGVVYVNCVLSSGTITGTPTVTFGTSMPSQTTGNAYITLFVVTGYTVTPSPSFTIEQSVTHSLGFQQCGTDNNFWAV